MNGAKFDQETFEKYKKYPNHNMEWFKDKYAFRDETEFLMQLTRIYGGDEETARGHIEDIKDRDKKARRNNQRKAQKANKNKKFKNDVVNANAMGIYADHVKPMSTMVAVAINDIGDGTESNVEETIVAKTVAPESEILKNKLVETESVLEKIKLSLKTDIDLYEEYLKKLEDGVANIEELKKLFKDEQTRIAEIQTAMYEITSRIEANSKAKENIIAEIAELNEQLIAAETVTVYFGNSEVTHEYNLIAKNIEIDETEYNSKLMKMIQEETFEELSIKMTRKIAKILLTMEKITLENPGKKIVATFEASDDEVVNMIRVLQSDVEIKIK